MSTRPARDRVPPHRRRNRADYLAWIRDGRAIREAHGILAELVLEPTSGDGDTVVITIWPSHEIFDAWIATPSRDQLTASETSKLASADVANVLFIATGTPVLRDGTVFLLPGIAIEVAKECSGIRSSLVLFITSLLASYLFLRSPWRRASLVAAVIPLGLLRNGVRILTISLLCVHVGPQMINSVIHRRGGPFFFTASLIPLFLLLWWLRRGEVARQARKTIVDAERKSLSANAPVS